MIDLKQIQQAIESAESGRTAKESWNPKHCGEIDIRIASDGTWYHEGTAIKRQPLVKLFASVLRKESDGAFYLVTPVEKMRIQVDDAPFLAHTLEVTQDGDQQALVFTTNIDERIVVDQTHPIRIESNPDTQEPRPYIVIHNNLEALISRNAYMDLINMGQLEMRDGVEHLVVHSQGVIFSLGHTHF